MNIYVCVKQVPNTNEVKIDPVKNTLIRDNVESILNHDDANALEEALRLKEEWGAHVTVLTMGPPQAEEVLRECLAMGADQAVLITDRAFGGSDTWATSNILASAISKLSEERPADIIFAGRQAIDGDTAQVGPQIAEKLGIPQATYVQKADIYEDNILHVQRQLEDGYELLELKMPVLLTAIKELNSPRYMTVTGIYSAYEKKIEILGFHDLDVDERQIGLKASPTRVMRSFVPEPKSRGMIFKGEIKSQVLQLAHELKEKHII